jgi:hypothetical protein
LADFAGGEEFFELGCERVGLAGWVLCVFLLFWAAEEEACVARCLVQLKGGRRTFAGMS